MSEFWNTCFWLSNSFQIVVAGSEGLRFLKEGNWRSLNMILCVYSWNECKCPLLITASYLVRYNEGHIHISPNAPYFHSFNDEMCCFPLFP